MDTAYLRLMAQFLVAVSLTLFLSSCQTTSSSTGPSSLEALAKQGDAVAQYNLGKQYGSMEGTENHKNAVKWLRKSAEQGYVEGQCVLLQMEMEKSSVQVNEYTFLFSSSGKLYLPPPFPPFFTSCLQFLVSFLK